jgi:hypothetical protein
MFIKPFAEILAGLRRRGPVACRYQLFGERHDH